jgi:hypothetical protein
MMLGRVIQDQIGVPGCGSADDNIHSELQHFKIKPEMTTY